MKTLFKLFVVMAAMAVIAISCTKEEPVVNGSKEGDLINLTIIAGNPGVNASTKTEMQGLTPYWSVGDAIGVSNGSKDSNYKFTTSITAASETATFTGSAVSSKLYAYYPYTTNGVSDSGAKVDLPAIQHPTVSSFDGKADIMVAKPFTVDPENTTVSNLEFARLGAIVKVVLKDPESLLSSQHPSSVSLTADSDLVGRVYIEMTNQALGSIYYNAAKTVTAEYSGKRNASTVIKIPSGFFIDSNINFFLEETTK